MAVSKRLRFEILRRDNHTCQYCGEKAPNVTLHVDHVKPKTLGGTDGPENLVAACKECNAGKSSMPADASHVAEISQRNSEWQKTSAEMSARMRGTVERDKSYCEDFTYIWSAEAKRLGVDGALPDGYEGSLYNWSGIGVPQESLEAAATIALGKKYLETESRFKYFAGIIWKQIKSLEMTLEPGAVYVYTEDEYWSGWQEGFDTGEERTMKNLPTLRARVDPLSVVVDGRTTDYLNQAIWSLNGTH